MSDSDELDEELDGEEVAELQEMKMEAEGAQDDDDDDDGNDRYDAARLALRRVITAILDLLFLTRSVVASDAVPGRAAGNAHAGLSTKTRGTLLTTTQGATLTAR